jgi:peptidoglycan/xylan/chitin deacetylase (PgdA/CDA1 family)
MPDRAINLTFHGVGEPQRELEAGEQNVWISRDRFVALLDAVTGRDDLRITFDDGNVSDVDAALPELRERGLQATFFVVAGRLGEPCFVDESGVRALADAGMGIGCHGMRHRPWRGLDDQALTEELVEAKAVLERVIERPVIDAACPFGSYDRRVLRRLRGCGYRRVYTSDRGTARVTAFVQARNSVGLRDSAELLQRIAAAHSARHRALPRSMKLAVKRWR